MFQSWEMQCWQTGTHSNRFGDCLMNSEELNGYRETGGAAPAWGEPEPGNGLGGKAGYRKITATVPQDAYQALIRESARRKIAGEPNQLLSALLREAISDYMAKLRPQP